MVSLVQHRFSFIVGSAIPVKVKIDSRVPGTGISGHWAASGNAPNATLIKFNLGDIKCL